MKTIELSGTALDWSVTQCDYMGTAHDVWNNFRNECHYSTDWAQGGPIIEREKIETFIRDEKWFSYSSNSTPEDFYGETPLIAAMRCYVASKLGNDVDISSELTTGESK